MDKQNRTPLTVKSQRVLGANLIAGIPDDLPEEIAAYWNKNRDQLHAREREMLSNILSVIIDPRFKLIKTIKITIPGNYIHATQITSFAKKNRKKFYGYNDAITDANFAKVTTKLAPGQKLQVKVFQITKRTTSEECLVYLKSQNAILAGAQGASLTYELAEKQLPIGKRSVSFDEKEALWKDSDGSRRVPCLDRLSDGDWLFRLGIFEDGWSDGSCLLCFCDLD